MQTKPGSEAIDFPSLALDAAIQLDHLEKQKNADLEVISTFGKYLASPFGNAPTGGLFALSENPVNVEILNSAFFSVEGTPSANMKELEDKLKILVKRVNDVGSGASSDERVVATLKRFCLSLHRVLLDDLAPAADDEWMPIHDGRFA